MKNQIDHLLISRQLRSAVLDTRVQRGGGGGPMSTASTTSSGARHETQQARQHEEVQTQIEHGQTEGQRHKTDVLRGSEKEAKGEQSREERGDRGVVGGTEEGIRRVRGGVAWVPQRQEQALDQPASVEGVRREERNQDQAGQYQVRDDTEQDQGGVHAEGQRGEEKREGGQEEVDDREGPGGTDRSRERESQGAVRYYQTTERQGTEENGGNHQQGWKTSQEQGGKAGKMEGAL